MSLRLIALLTISCCLIIPVRGQAATVEPAVAGGQISKMGSYGYVVRLEMIGDNGRQPFCSGSLISPRYILTAAHCLALTDNDNDKGLSLTGLSVRFANLQGAPTRDVVRVAYWKDFNPYLMANRAQADLALLELSDDGPTTPVTLSAVTPAMVKKAVTFVGYGHYQKRSNKMSSRAFVGLSRIRRPQACSWRDSQDYLRPFVGSEICTTAKLPRLKGGACQGDSGGPLLGQGKLIGVTSWSLEYNCKVKSKRRQTVFARASFAERWLRQQTGASLFGLPALNQNTEKPPEGMVWVAEATPDYIVAAASAPSNSDDKAAVTDIHVTAFEMQGYYRDNKKSLLGFTPLLGKAQYTIAADGQSAELSAPGSLGPCSALLRGEELISGQIGIRCPGGDWQATVVANISVTLKNDDIVEKVLSAEVSAAAPEAKIIIPESIKKLDAKEIKVHLFARLYNQDDNGATASSDIERLPIDGQQLTK